MSRDSDRMASNLVCFLLGAAVGAAVALLYAPQEGQVTRTMLGEKANTIREKAEEVTETIAQATKEKIHVASEKVQALRKQVPTPENVLQIEDDTSVAPEGTA